MDFLCSGNMRMISLLVNKKMNYLKYIKKGLKGNIPNKYKKKEGRIVMILNDKNSLFLIIFISIGFGILFIVIIFFIICLLKKKSSYTELNNEKVDGALYNNKDI